MKVLVARKHVLVRVAVRLLFLFIGLGLWLELFSARADDLTPTPTLTSQASAEPNLARFGDFVLLESFTLPGTSKPVPGYPFVAVLNWQVLKTIDQDLIATLSLYNDGRQYLVQVDAVLAAGLQAGQRISTTHTLFVPEVSPNTTLYFVTQRQKDTPMVLQASLRVAQHNQRVPLASSRRSYATTLATWRRDDLALTECHTTKHISATNPITLTRPSPGEITQGYWYAHRGADFADVRGRPVRAASVGQVITSKADTIPSIATPGTSPANASPSPTSNAADLRPKADHSSVGWGKNGGCLAANTRGPP